MQGEYTTPIAEYVQCLCVWWKKVRDEANVLPCPLCQGTHVIHISDYQRIYLRACAEESGSGEFAIALPPTTPITLTPMGLYEALLATQESGGCAMQTVGHVTYWVVPAGGLGYYQLSARPYEPKILALTEPTDLGRIYAMTQRDLVPHPHRNQWYPRKKQEAFHGR